jgi:Endonuclease NucS
MPVEVGLWRVDDQPVRLGAAGMPTEARLEELIEADPTILGEPLLIIGRQVITSFGKIIDLLAVDSDGVLNILELKRDRTPRDVVAQALDYGLWVRALTHGDVLAVFDGYGKREGVAFEAAFQQRFDRPPPEELNTGHRMTIIAAEVDPATQRIVEYLSSEYHVPINVVFFQYFEDAGHRYLARTWLIDQATTAIAKSNDTTKTKELWNGTDWYVSFGEFPGQRSWDDATKYGFVSAGGGDWFARTIQKPPVGSRVFTYIPKVGYVGVGEVIAEATPFNSAIVEVDGHTRKLSECPLEGGYEHEGGEEWILPVRWIRTRRREDAIRQPGMFANQNSAAKLRNRFTLEILAREFDLEDLD